ncbi:alpha/beta hydrolase [Pseudomaricurvus alkylphenolicus]|uniref:alpha/beta fold hydrolase n=1 Tax=Pseudomaricurvus alkylphenolicus TaxID=1306991 RepID=UPI00141EF858|nr:alpha/beta hydrolase [Pseudomaricurvus alkylphenolicus]NIB40967.1 alpha/beta hydrolase [Pseudomaricurvus alkylphenolicus]
MTTIELLLPALIVASGFWIYYRLPVSDKPWSILLNGLSGFLVSREHKGRPTPIPQFTTDMRYQGTTPPPNTSNKHGEIEYLDGDIPVIHWYEEVRGSVFHFVTAGNPANEAVVIVPGLPESWWAFHHQIVDLSSDYYVIAVDSKGYGQSDKRLYLDYTNPGMAEDMAALVDKLGIKQFNMMGHDRGAVVTDHMTNVASLKGRILRYVRMQQSFNEPHGKPVPPHHIMKTKFGEALFRSRNFVSFIYRAWFPSNLSESTLQRLEYEFSFKGTAAAMRKYFETTDFGVELNDRHNTLFNAMTMPMLLLQGQYDKGQHPEEYGQSPAFVTDARVQFIHANHFLHLENPVATNRAIRKFFTEVKVADKPESKRNRVKAKEQAAEAS